jgi:phosphate acetyltransferase
VNRLRQIIQRAKQSPAKIAFPEATEPRTLQAAARLLEERIVEPVLVGPQTDVVEACKGQGIDPGSLQIEDPQTSSHRDRCIDAAVEAQARRGLLREKVAERLASPLSFAAAMVRAGVAGGTVAGAIHSTAETLRAALRFIRPAPGAKIVSSFFLMGLREPTPTGDDVLAFADCGLVPYPDAEELAEIARRTADSYRLLCDAEPRVALLSFSTHGSAHHKSVKLVVEARELLGRNAPDFAFDGELQLDAALIPEVGNAKAPTSPVAGRANVLIFPNLDAGNIGYKLVERLGGAQAVGPLVQGLSRPANDLSRGCSVDDIVLAAAVTALQAGSPDQR